MVFRRRRETDESSDEREIEDVDDPTTGDDNDARPDTSGGDIDDQPVRAAAIEPYAVVVPPRPTGPWDIEDVPDDEIPRVDLGGLAVPVPDGVEVRVEVQDDVPVAATLVDGNSALQVHAFAAPKSSGLWAEVRTEIADSLKEGGGSAEEVTGPFGPELLARLPQEGGGSESARFLGVDGPRWFLRGLLTGAGSTSPGEAKRLEEAFRQVVVNRGTDAMAPRDVLPLHLPREALDAASAAHAEAHSEAEADAVAADQAGVTEPDRRIQLPERGPEITEIQ